MDSSNTKGVPSKRYRDWLAIQNAHEPVERSPRAYTARPSVICSWGSMISRCVDPEHADYESYGGRGIAVCHAWLNSRLAFIEDMGPRPHGNAGIKRRDTCLGFTKSNCYWGTGKEII